MANSNSSIRLKPMEMSVKRTVHCRDHHILISCTMKIRHKLVILIIIYIRYYFYCITICIFRFFLFHGPYPLGFKLIYGFVFSPVVDILPNNCRPGLMLNSCEVCITLINVVHKIHCWMIIFLRRQRKLQLIKTPVSMGLSGNILSV